MTTLLLWPGVLTEGGIREREGFTQIGERVVIVPLCMHEALLIRKISNVVL